MNSQSSPTNDGSDFLVEIKNTLPPNNFTFYNFGVINFNNEPRVSYQNKILTEINKIKEIISSKNLPTNDQNFLKKFIDSLQRLLLIKKSCTSLLKTVHSYSWLIEALKSLFIDLVMLEPSFLIDLESLF